MGQIAVGSRDHIDSLFSEYEKQGTIVSLYDPQNNIKLLGPIAVRATGPTTFQVIDTNKYERHQKDTRDQLRDQLLLIPNKINTGGLPRKTTKRPSLHFEPISEGDKRRKVVGTAVQNIGPVWEGSSVKPVDPYRNRRWPRSKPTPRSSNLNPRQRSLKVRFEELSNESSAILRNKIVRFPS